MSANTDVCRVCLVDHMNLYSVRNDLQNVYERIAREKYNKVGYPVHMCSICLTVLRKCHRFMETARDTNNVLEQWYNQQNEKRVARPLYTYSRSEVEVVCNKIISEKVKSEQEEVQTDYAEFYVDVNIEKKDIDEQTDNSELLVDSPNDSTNTDTIEYSLKIEDDDLEPDLLFDNENEFEEKCSLPSNLDDHTNIETTIKNISKKISPHDYAIPPIKKHNTIETKPLNQALETSRSTAANSETSNNITPLNITPSQPDITEILQTNTKTKPTSDKNNSKNKKTAILNKIVKTKAIRKKNKDIGLVRNTITNRNDSKNSALKSDKKQKEKINKKENKKNELMCDICNFKCFTKIVLTMHINRHDDSTPINAITNRNDSNNSALISDRKHKEKINKKVSSSQSAARNSIIIIENENKRNELICDICNFKCITKIVLAMHMKQHDDSTPINTIRNRNEHNKLALKSDKKQKEKINKKDYSSPSSASNSLIMIENDKKRNELICEMCNFKCTTKIVLTLHMKQHDDSTPHLCDLCGATFRCLGSLKHHNFFKHKTGTTKKYLSDPPTSEKPKTKTIGANKSVEQRKRIVALHNRGYNISQIARETHYSINTVKLWVKRFEGEGSVVDRVRTGRPHLMDQAQVREMINEYKTNGPTPTQTLADRYGVSTQTVRRLLRSEGIRLRPHRKTKGKVI